AWPFLLCTGVLAAVTISKYHLSRPFLLVVLCATVTEAFVSVQLPWRQYNNPVEIPNVYTQVEGPVLDLYPEVKILGRYSDHLIWFSTMGCFFQSSHGRAISDNCVATDPKKQHRKKISKWLIPVLMNGDTKTAKSTLERYGYTSVVVYPDLFTEGDRRRLLHAFYAIDSDPVISENAGMYAMLFRLAASPVQERTLPESERSVQWGTSVLVDAKNLEFDFFPGAGVTFKPHQLLVDGTSYPLERRRDSPSHFATIAGNFDGVSTLQVVSDDVLWEGRFASGASDEQLTVSEEEGFLAVTSVSAQSPASRDIPKWATRSWLFLSVLFGIFHVHRFWQRRWLFRAEKENRAVGL
ncbi:MAG: hypothetical protein VX278_01280, partial [Myxococcota bacterium]|nr:hypothetical protein [Myxococcota bacterium]